MKKLIVFLLAIVLSNTLQSQSISEEDRQKSLKLLNESMAKLKRLTKDLSEVQQNFKPAEDRWSIKKNVDHLVAVEDRVWEIIHKSLQASGEGQKSEILDEDFIRKLSTREENFKAPKILQPDEQKYASFQDALKAFVESRERTINFVTATNDDLRGHFSPNPVFGNLDTYQWTLHVSAHCYRHIEQIEEILVNPSFPKR